MPNADHEENEFDATSSTSSPPAIQSIEESRIPSQHRTQGSFVSKLYTMLQTPALVHLIAWTDDGTRFTISNITKFSEILPEFFKHNNPQSFVRQLNIYNFHKVHYSGNSLTPADVATDGPWEFTHPYFCRDSPHLLPQVKRKAKATSGRANSTLDIQSDVQPKRRARKRSNSDSGGTTSTRSPPSLREPDATSPPAPVTAAINVPSPRSIQGRDSPIPASLPTPPSSYPGYSRSVSYEAPPYHDLFRPQYRPPVFPARLDHLPSFSRAPYPDPSTPSQHYSAWRDYNDNPLAKQVSGLDNQVRMLAEGLYRSQQDAYSERVATASVVRLLLKVVTELDPNGRYRQEIDSAVSALSQLSTSNSPPTSSYSHPPPPPPGAKPTSRPPLPAHIKIMDHNLPSGFIQSELDYFDN